MKKDLGKTKSTGMNSIIRGISCLLFTWLIGLMCCNSSLAKCPQDYIQVRLKLQSEDNAPIDNASVSLFVDNNEIGFNASHKPGDEYVVLAHYNTYSGKTMSGADSCRKEKLILTVVAHSTHYWPLKIKREIKNISKTEIVDLGPVLLKRN